MKVKPQHIFAFAVTALSAISSASAWAASGAFTSFQAAGLNAADIIAERDAFRIALGGGSTPGANGSFGGVRREINWDAVPNAKADPSFLPNNFFNVNSPRGVVFSTPGDGFLVSANSGQPSATMFGFADQLQAFSPQRLFTAVNSNITDITFFTPGTSEAAASSAFGVIFTGVEAAGQTKMEFFNAQGNLIYQQDALVSGNQGFSFLGAMASGGNQISRVRLTSGLATLGGNGILNQSGQDLVAMDDFIYSEPGAVAAVPEPSSWAMLLGGLTCLVGLRRRSQSA